MDFRLYFSIIWRKRLVVIIVLATAIITVLLGSLLTTPIYSATSTLRIASASGGSLSYTDFIYTDRLVNTYVKIATSRPVLAELQKRLSLKTIPSISVATIPNTELINVTIEDPNPAIAESSANTLAAILIEDSSSLYAGGGKTTESILSDQLAQLQTELNAEREAYDKLISESPSNSESIAAALRSIDLKQTTYESILTQLEDARLRNALRSNIISLVEPAITPTKPIRPDITLNLGLAGILGLLASLGLVFVMEHFDKTLHLSTDIEQIVGQSALGKIPTSKSQMPFLPMDGDEQYSDAFKRLRAAFLYKIQNMNLRVIMITSPEPKDGKSTISANLAVVLAQTGKKVILVDTDVLAPKIHEMFNLSNETGLTNVLNGQCKLKDALQPTRYEWLQILTSGSAELEEDSSLQKINLRDLLIDLSARDEIVIIDSPAILSVAEATDLATLVDAIVIVVRRSFTHADTLTETRKYFEKLNVLILGYVINRAEPQPGGHYYSDPTRSIKLARLTAKEPRTLRSEKVDEKLERNR